jgi:hypothetical protein
MHAEAKLTFWVWIDRKQNSVGRHGLANPASSHAVPNSYFGQPMPTGGMTRNAIPFGLSGLRLRICQPGTPKSKMKKYFHS